jgi:hypothetical protein
LTPLLLAVACDDLPLAKLLLEQDANPAAPEWSTGLTPMHFVRSVDMLELLRGYGARADVVSVNGVSFCMVMMTLGERNQSLLSAVHSKFTKEELDVPRHDSRNKQQVQQWPTVLETAIALGNVSQVNFLVERKFSCHPVPFEHLLAGWTSSAAAQVMKSSVKGNVAKCIDLVKARMLSR